MTSKLKKSSCIFLITMIFCLACIPSLMMSFDQDKRKNAPEMSIPRKINTSTSHTVITITGDAELAAFPNKTGLGIESNPYIIEGLTISGPGTSPSHAIKISNTTAWLVIKACTITNRNDSFVNWWNNNDGIRVLYSSNVNITGNFFSRCATAIDLYACNNCVVENNDLQPDDGAGVFIMGGTGILISKNSVLDGSGGIFLVDCNKTVCSSNDIIGSSCGFSGENCINITLASNNISRGIEGIVLTHSKDSLISNNRLSWFHVRGIGISGTNNTQIRGNFVWIQIYDSVGSIYDRKTIWINDSNGIIISCNAFWGDPVGSAGVQWDNGTHGNFWGNYYARYQGQSIMDGVFWSKPYIIDGISPGSETQDKHPLVFLPGYGSPLIYSPISINMVAGTIGKEILWMPMVDTSSVFDEFYHSYSIYKDGVLLRTGSWSAGSWLTISLDGISSGFYNYTIVVSDGTGGIARDTVLIFVSAGILGMEPMTFYILVALVAASIVVVLIFVQKRLKTRQWTKEKVTKPQHVLDPSGIETISALARSSSSITVARLASLLHIDEAFVWENIARWANKFGFSIHNDEITFGNGNIDAFVNDLDNKFVEWDKNTRDKLGKT